MPKAVSVSTPHPADVHLGFVPLLDAAPLILAAELGYFADEGLTVALHRQIGWGNVRDKLVYGQLHASHALVGMPPASVLGLDRFPEPVVAVMGLGTGCNAITLSRRLADAGVGSATALAQWLGGQPRGAHASPPVIAHVFGCSMHHYLLREWLAGGGVDPDRDVRLAILPPPQMGAQMQRGYLDGFCVGEPWNTLAEHSGVGRVIAATTDILPDHPEKVLAVNRRWLARGAEPVVALVRAVLRACGFCRDPKNAGRVAAVLSRPGYLDMPADLLLRSLTWCRTSDSAVGATTKLPSGDPGATFPSGTHAAWVLGQMVRWGHLPADTDVIRASRQAIDTAVFRRAADSMGIACPADDFPPMRVRGGWFDAMAQKLKQAGPNHPLPNEQSSIQPRTQPEPPLGRVSDEPTVVPPRRGFSAATRAL